MIALCPVIINAQQFTRDSNPVSVSAFKFLTSPTIDGAVEPSEWDQASTVARELVTRSTNQPSGEKGQIWIGYDDHYLYVAARIVLQNPQSISADEYRDNVSLRGNDNFTLELDTFGTTTDASEIAFNANGATSLEIAGGRAAKTEWSGRVVANSRITATGWEGEVRIPWALLPMPSEGIRDMRFDIDWYVSSTGRGVGFHSTQGDPTRMHTLASIDVPEISRKSGVLLLPYVYAGYNEETKEHIANAGLDFKTQLSEQTSLVGTINPDFRNIEGDILDLDFSNFERLADETRPFFQEGSDYYFFGHGRRIFASQRIKAFDMGANLYGNLGGRSRLGILSTIDFGEQATAAGSFTHNPDPLTEFTGSFAALQRTGENNTAGRFAASRRFGDWNFFSETNITDDDVEGTGSASTVGAFWETPGWEGRLFLVDVSGDFFPRIGFASETDFKGASGSLTRQLEFNSGTVKQVEIDLDLLDYERRGGGHYREGVGLDIELNLNNVFELDFAAEYEHFEDRHDTVYAVGLQYPRNNPYRQAEFGYEFGKIDDVDYRSIEAGINYRPIKRVQLSLRGQAVQHIEDEEQLVFDFSYEMGRYQSFGGRVVYTDNEWNWFASFRLSGNEGAEYFVIVGDPNASSFQKTLILKVSIPLSIGG